MTQRDDLEVMEVTFHFTLGNNYRKQYDIQYNVIRREDLHPVIGRGYSKFRVGSNSCMRGKNLSERDGWGWGRGYITVNNDKETGRKGEGRK